MIFKHIITKGWNKSYVHVQIYSRTQVQVELYKSSWVGVLLGRHRDFTDAPMQPSRRVGALPLCMRSVHACDARKSQS